MKTVGKFLLLCLVALATDAKKTRLTELAKPASSGEFPYQVALYLDGRFFCGGSLISKTHVLTAAHCVKPITQNPYRLGDRVVVEVGSVRQGFGQSHRIARAAYHAKFSDDIFEPLFMPNDIGVLTLKTPVTESSTVKVIALPSAETVVPTGADVVISGFGASRAGGPTSPVLKKDHFKVINQGECNQYYTQNLKKTITVSQICAKSAPGYGACQGDSGGPLVYNNQVVGVVSGGDGVCNSGTPDVYTKVSSFLEFIKKQMNVKPGSSTQQDQGSFHPQIPDLWDADQPIIPEDWDNFETQYQIYNPYQLQFFNRN